MAWNMLEQHLAIFRIEARIDCQLAEVFEFTFDKGGFARIGKIVTNLISEHQGCVIHITSRKEW